MDDLIIYGLFFLVYLVFQLLGARKKRPAGTKPSPAPDNRPRPAGGSSEEVTLDDALREIRQALGMETPSPKPVPEPASPTRAPLPKRAPIPRSRLEKTENRYEREEELIDLAAPPEWGDEFKELEKHYSDHEFEALPRGVEGYEDPHYRKPAASRTPSAYTQVRRPATTPGRVLRKLSTPKAAREAFVLHEILGPPRGLRR